MSVLQDQGMPTPRPARGCSFNIRVCVTSTRHVMSRESVSNNLSLNSRGQRSKCGRKPCRRVGCVRMEIYLTAVVNMFRCQCKAVILCHQSDKHHIWTHISNEFFALPSWQCDERKSEVCYIEKWRKIENVSLGDWKVVSMLRCGRCMDHLLDGLTCWIFGFEKSFNQDLSGFRKRCI